MGARRFLFSDLRWIRRLLDLSANAAARSICVETGGCRFPNRWIRRAGHSLPPARWMAIRSDWRIASSFMDFARRGCFRIVARRAVDASIHRWRARMRRLARHRQWSSISTCTSIFSRLSELRSPDWSARWAEWADSFRLCFLGMFRDRLGVVWPGFLLLSAVACLLWWMNGRVFLTREEALAAKLPPALSRTADRVRAGAWATLWTLVLIAAIVLGSRNLQNFDPALVIYTFAIIFATWGVIYHYSVWIRKPPTYVYWKRGWQLFRERGVFRSLATSPRWQQLIFWRKRSSQNAPDCVGRCIR